jgi:hypothetical protein
MASMYGSNLPAILLATAAVLAGAGGIEPPNGGIKISLII